MNSVGIDISADQSSVAEGPWLFVVHKATEGHDYKDPQFAARYPTLVGQNETLRGAYHYARPGDGFSGVQQADFFADTVLAAGFVPGQDLWQLDCEGTGNEGVSQATWQAFILQFMSQATLRLGARGFIYGGYSFLFTPEAVNAPQAWTTVYNWWDADYGPNDGAVHPLSAPEPYATNCVIHQFSSAGNLDRNVVNNTARWDALFPAPVNLSVLAKLGVFLKAIMRRPMQRGDKGPQILQLNRMLLRYGYAVSGDGYDDRTAHAILGFKAKHGLKNRDANVCGLPCVLALLKGLPK
jgi:GH25 family lysozyme M1 (1,4-beta-N-acetylmuramidase)